MGADKDSPVLDAYRRNYVRAQYMWVQMFTEHLTDCSRVFKGDLQAMLILAIVGQTYLFQMLKAGSADYDAGAPVPLLDGVAINASSLSAVLEIPRETVRRKLDVLAREGWIEKIDAGWRLAVNGGESQARRDLAALDQRSMGRIAKLVSDFNALAEKTKATEAERG